MPEKLAGAFFKKEIWSVSGIIVFQTGPPGFSALGLFSPVSHDFPVPGAMFDAAPLLAADWFSLCWSLGGTSSIIMLVTAVERSISLVLTCFLISSPPPLPAHCQHYELLRFLPLILLPHRIQVSSAFSDLDCFSDH